MKKDKDSAEEIKLIKTEKSNQIKELTQKYENIIKENTIKFQETKEKVIDQEVNIYWYLHSSNHVI
jgi:hypothetical protein